MYYNIHNMYIITYLYNKSMILNNTLKKWNLSSRQTLFLLKKFVLKIFLQAYTYINLSTINYTIYLQHKKQNKFNVLYL